MGQSSKESDPLAKLKALRGAVISTERNRARSLIPPEEQAVAPVDPAEPPEDQTVPRTKAAKGPRRTVVSEDALQLSLTPEIRRLLGRQCRPGGWEPARLIPELIRTLLAGFHPSIKYGDRIVATEDTYRALYRNPLETNLRLSSNQGTFVFQAIPTHAVCRQWLEHFRMLGAEDPDRMARQMHVFQLHQQLQGVEDYCSGSWCKQIDPDAFQLLPVNSLEETT